MPKSLRSTAITLLTTEGVCRNRTQKAARRNVGTWDPLAAINVSLLYFVFHGPTDRMDHSSFISFSVFMFSNFTFRPRLLRRLGESNKVVTAAATAVDAV